MIKNRDFNILLFGRLIANLGDSLYSIATMLLVYHLTSSVFYSGFALFLTTSMGVLQIFLSPLLDRINIKKTLILFQWSQAILLLIIPLLHYLDYLTVVNVLIIMPLVTLLNQLIYPSQISLLPRVLKQEDLIKGNSLFTMAYQGSDALFNAIAGFIITLVGIYSVYYLNSMTFVINAILFMLLSQKVAHINKEVEKATVNTPVKQYFKDFKEGLSLWKNKVLLPILIGVIIINFATTCIYANLPSFSNTNIHYSWLMAASGIGILIGSFLITKLKLTQLPLNKTYIVSIFVIGLCWAAVSLLEDSSTTAQVCSVIVFFMGWVPIGILNILSQTIIQISIPTSKLGMAMGSMIGVSVAFAPLGALIGGLLGRLFSPATAILCSALFIIIVGFYWLTKKSIRTLSTIDLLSKKEVMQ